MPNESIYRTWNAVLAYYSLCLAVVGTVGNFTASGVCLRKSLRKVPTFVFYAVMCVTNAFSLYAWNLNGYFLMFNGYSMQDAGLWQCRLGQTAQLTFTQASSFLLIALTIERYLSVKIKSWRMTLFNAKRATILSLTIVLVFFLFNVHMMFTLQFNPVANKSRLGLCASQEVFKMWRQMHTYIYSMVPFLVLFITNSLMIYEVIRSSRMKKSSAKSRSMSISVIAFTVAFFFLTAPHAVLGGYFLAELRSTEMGQVINTTFVALAYTFYGSNFIVLLATNSKFSKELKNIVNGSKAPKEKTTEKSTKPYLSKL